MFVNTTLLILLVILILIISQLMRFLFTGNTPPIITPKSTRKKLIGIFKLNEKSVFYDLGCGNSTFLLELSKSFPKTEFVGIESSIFYYLVSKLRIILSNKTNVQVIFGNFIKTDLTPATHLYSWIFPKDMDKLCRAIKEKDSEKKIIYSLGFPLSEIEPTKIITLENNKRFARTLYIYSIRGKLAK